LWIAQHYTAWAAAAFLGLVCLVCCLGLFLVPEPASAHRVGGLRRSLVEVVKDVWQVARSRLGWLALVLCFLPIGSGAASGLFAAVAGDWRASANSVALATGVLAGLAAAFGCLLGGWVSDRMNRKGAYALYGLLLAGCASAMAIAPRTETMYIAFTLLYSVISGLTYAGFTAFTLEAMGTGAAATKYSLFASLSNMPIWYMTLIDGKAHDRWGSTGMLHTEAVMGVIGIVVFGAILLLFPARRTIAVPIPDVTPGLEPAVSSDD
jgi:predicted MFS family arabinose efflux permease